MLIALVVIFVLTYIAIALEHSIGINKSAPALVGAGLLWTIYALAIADHHIISEQLGESMIEIAQIVFFLMGAMTIVEVVDAHNGFELITRRIYATKLVSLLWIVGITTFFLSAILDNLTTTIVMISLMRKLLGHHKDRLLFAGIIIIAANSGGAWSPIGDVTTTMLWIGGQVTATAIIKGVLMPSLVSMIVPLLILTYLIRGRSIEAPQQESGPVAKSASSRGRNIIFFAGLGILMAVPAFKTVTNLPPFLGILFGLGILWLIADLLHRDSEDGAKDHLSLANALARIDMSALVFFTGILLSIATLEHSSLLSSLAHWLDHMVGRQDLIVMLIGIFSAIVDNVPLVAAAMGMYDIKQFPADHFLWEFLAYCAGTGGSILIIGSAAGVAAMGLERIRFFWYLRNIGTLAFIGYFAGAGVYLAEHYLT